jgi:hypothetical protein
VIVSRTGRSLYTPDGGDPEDSDSFRVTFDPDRNDVEVVVVEAIATIKNTDSEGLDPLGRTIDCDALGRVVAEDDVGEITFRYKGLLVTVDVAGEVRLSWESAE